MNNIIENDEKMLGYAKDLKRQAENEIEKFEKEKKYVEKVCGSVDNDYYDNEISILKDLLGILKTFEDYDLIIIKNYLMGCFTCRKASVIDSETKEEIL